MINLHSIAINPSQSEQSSPVEELSIHKSLTQRNPLFIAPFGRPKPPLLKTKSLDDRDMRIAHVQVPLIRKGYKPQILQEQVAVQNQVHRDIALTMLEESACHQKHKEILHQLLSLQAVDSTSVETLLKRDSQLKCASSVSDIRHAMRSSGSNTPTGKSRRNSGCSSKSRKSSACSGNASGHSTEPGSPEKTISIDEAFWKQQSSTYLRGRRDSAIRTVNAKISEISEKRIFPNAAPEAPQLILNRKQYYTLIKNSNTEHYELLNHEGISKSTDGHYIFVVSESDPTQIRCLPEQSIFKEAHATAWEGLTKGHTSLTDGKPVLAAGTLYFENGKLIQWDNGSGHYATRASLMLKNIAHLKHLLPRSKFVFTFREMGHSGQRVFLNSPQDKSLPPELEKIIKLDMTVIPKALHQTIRDTANLYQILHQLKYAIETQINNLNEALLLPDIYSQQTLKDILSFQQRDTGLGTNFLSAYLDILTLGIQKKWLSAEEIFYSISYKSPQSQRSFIEQCAWLSHKYTILARKHAQLVGEIFQSQAVDSENFIQTLLGYYSQSKLRRHSNTVNQWRALIAQALQGVNKSKSKGGYFSMCLQKSPDCNVSISKSIYSVFSYYKLISELTRNCHVLNSSKRKSMLKSIRRLDLLIHDLSPRKNSKQKVVYHDKVQSISDLLANTVIRKSLHKQLQNIDQEIKNALFDEKMTLYLQSQMPNINNIWHLKTERYAQRYKIYPGDNDYIIIRKNNALKSIRNLPEKFYQDTLKAFKCHPQISKLIRMQALESYQPLAIPNTLEVEKTPQKKNDTDQTLIEVSYSAVGDTLEIINKGLKEHLKNVIIPVWGNSNDL